MNYPHHTQWWMVLTRELTEVFCQSRFVINVVAEKCLRPNDPLTIVAWIDLEATRERLLSERPEDHDWYFGDIEP